MICSHPTKTTILKVGTSQKKRGSQIRNATTHFPIKLLIPRTPRVVLWQEGVMSATYPTYEFDKGQWDSHLVKWVIQLSTNNDHPGDAGWGWFSPSQFYRELYSKPWNKAFYEPIYTVVCHRGFGCSKFQPQENGCGSGKALPFVGANTCDFCGGPGTY